MINKRLTYRNGLQMIAVAACLFPQIADAYHVGEKPPERSGFTLSLGLGAGATTMMPKGGSTDTQAGVGGLNISIGGFITPDIAILAKIAGVNWGVLDDKFEKGISFVAGPAAQYWFNDHFFATGGIGVSFDHAEWEAVPIEDTRAGFGLMAGLGVNLIPTRRHAFGLYYDFTAGFHGDGETLTYQGGIFWQFH